MGGGQPLTHLALLLRDLVEKDAAVQLVKDAAVVLDDATDVLDDAIGLEEEKERISETNPNSRKKAKLPTASSKVRSIACLPPKPSE